MAFTITFPSHDSGPSSANAAEWLTEQGEPFDIEGPTLALRALPVRIVTSEGPMQAWVDLDDDTPLERVIDLLFALSIAARADVRLAGTGNVTRAALWLRLADEQDRRRLVAALDRAAVHGRSAEVFQKLWPVVSALEPGRDLRWDAASGRIVELIEVGGGISAAEAAFLKEDAAVGDVVARPVAGTAHVVAWRWLSEAWPGLADR